MVLVVLQDFLKFMGVGGGFCDDDVVFFLADFLFSAGNFTLKDAVDNSADA